MPLYEYKCRSCGDVFELIQKFSDQPLTIHDKCGGAVERLMSPPALQFKGAGWYVTDYGKGNNKESKAKPDGSNGAAKTDGKTDSSGKSDTTSKSESRPTTSTPSASKSDK